MKLIAVLAGIVALTSCSPIGAAAAAPSMVVQTTTVPVPYCQPFLANTDELVACGRALGTLQSLLNPNTEWRLRYFFRYEEMPCGEAPTVEEAYAFHMALDDLQADTDLTPDQMLDIRNAMYSGQPDCSGG